MARSKPTDPESGEGGSAPQRSPEKTIGITPSQILEIAPGKPTQPSRPRRRMQDLSMWLGNVLSSSEFVPDAGRKRRRFPWRILVALVVVGVAGGLVWTSWPKVPFSNSEWRGLERTSPVPAAPPAPSAPAQPTTASPVNPPSATSAGVEAAPTEPAVAKKSQSTKHASKHKRKRHHRKTSRSF
jgi:hypothetical protein